MDGDPIRAGRTTEANNVTTLFMQNNGGLRQPVLWIRNQTESGNAIVVDSVAWKDRCRGQWRGGRR
jgi:hypothetical protein